MWDSKEDQDACFFQAVAVAKQILEHQIDAANAVNRADDNTCPVNLAARLHLGRDEYAWIDRLLEDLSLCEREALLYITQGKRLGMERFVEIGNTSDEPLNTAA